MSGQQRRSPVPISPELDTALTTVRQGRPPSPLSRFPNESCAYCVSDQMLPRTRDQVDPWASSTAQSLSLVPTEIAFFTGPAAVIRLLRTELSKLGTLLVTATGTPDRLTAAADAFRRAQALETKLRTELDTLTKRSRGWEGASGDAFRRALGISTDWLAADVDNVGQVAGLLDTAASAVTTSRAEVTEVIRAFAGTLEQARAANGVRWTKLMGEQGGHDLATGEMVQVVKDAAAQAGPPAEKAVAELRRTIETVHQGLAQQGAKGGRSPYRSWREQGIKFQVSVGITKFLGGRFTLSEVPGADGKTKDAVVKLEVSAGTKGTYDKGFKRPSMSLITDAAHKQDLLNGARGDQGVEWTGGVMAKGHASIKEWGGIGVDVDAGYNFTTEKFSAEGSAHAVTGKDEEGNGSGFKASGSYSQDTGFDGKVRPYTTKVPDTLGGEAGIYAQVRIPGGHPAVDFVADNAITNGVGATVKAGQNEAGRLVDEAGLALNQSYIGAEDDPALTRGTGPALSTQLEDEEFDSELGWRASLQNRDRAVEDITEQYQRAGKQLTFDPTRDEPKAPR